MKLKIYFIIIISFFLINFSYSLVEGYNLANTLSYAGKSFSSLINPDYISYEKAMREYISSRIERRFGIKLDPNKYSAFDLLEIESLFKCKKSSESLQNFLNMFPKTY